MVLRVSLEARLGQWCQQNSPSAAAIPDLLGCAGPAGLHQRTPLPAQHKRTMLLQLEVLRLETILVCVTKK